MVILQPFINVCHHGLSRYVFYLLLHVCRKVSITFECERVWTQNKNQSILYKSAIHLRYTAWLNVKSFADYMLSNVLLLSILREAIITTQSSSSRFCSHNRVHNPSKGGHNSWNVGLFSLKPT